MYKILVITIGHGGFLVLKVNLHIHSSIYTHQPGQDYDRHQVDSECTQVYNVPWPWESIKFVTPIKKNSS